MLNHADGLHLEKFTDTDLDQIADCNDVFEIDLRSNRTAQPVDLGRLAHIQGYETCAWSGCFLYLNTVINRQQF